MVILVTILISITSILLSLYLFKKWFNHILIYVLSWALFIILYELKLMRFIEVKFEVWIIILLSFISLWLGTLTVILAKQSISKITSNPNLTDNFNTVSLYRLDLIRNISIIFSIIGLFASIHHWYALINEYGSIANVLIKANFIYRQRIQGESVDTIPYLFIASYIGVFFGAILTAYKKRLTFVAVLPFLGIILKGMATVGRGGIFVGFLLFINTFFLFRHKLSKTENLKTRFTYSSVFSILLLLVISIGSLNMVKEIRGSFENFEGTTRTLKKLKDVPVISPQIYLYFSSNIGVLSKYFEKGGEDPPIASNSLLPIYNVLTKFGIVEQQQIYPKGYFIPMWTNSATYLRDLHADFGYSGLFIVPYLLGIFATYYWFKFYERGNMLDFVLLTYIFVIISFSTFYMITRAALWFMSFLFLVIFVKYLDSYFLKKTQKELVNDKV